MSASTTSTGTCTWTFHQPDSTHPEGYWTVVSHCESGYSCSSSLDKHADLGSLKLGHKEFAAKVNAAYKDKMDRLTDHQKELLKDPQAVVATKQTFDMPCV